MTPDVNPHMTCDDGHNITELLNSDLPPSYPEGEITVWCADCETEITAVVDFQYLEAWFRGYSYD